LERSGDLRLAGGMLDDCWRAVQLTRPVPPRHATHDSGEKAQARPLGCRPPLVRELRTRTGSRARELHAGTPRLHTFTMRRSRTSARRWPAALALAATAAASFAGVAVISALAQ